MKRAVFKQLEAARKILDDARGEKRDLSADEKFNYNRLMDEIEEGKRAIRVEARKQDIEMGGTGELDYDPATEDGPLAARKAWGTGQATRDKQDPRSYRSLFHRNDTRPLDRGEFKDIGEFLQVLDSQRFDPRLKELRFQQQDIGQMGGFSVPSEYAAWLLDTSLEDEVIRPRAQVHAMESNVRHVPAWDSLDQTGGNLFGGIQGQWLAELEQMDAQTALMRSMTLRARKLGILANCSNELLQDSVGFVENLGKAIVRAIGYSLDHAFINGTGAPGPLGILNAPSLITVNRAGAFPSTAAGDNYAVLVQMYARLHKAGPGKPIWLVHPDILPEIQTLTDALGNLVFQANASTSIPTNLFGVPIVPCDKMPAAGTAGDVILVNLQNYYIGMRKEVSLDRSDAPGFTQDYTSFRALLRADGQPAWDKVLTKPDGSEVSWAVALE